MKLNVRRASYWLIAVVVAFVATVVVLNWRDPRLPAAHTRKITIAQFGDVFLYAPLYLAKDAGFFAERGLDVSLVSTGGDEKTWAAVVSGSAAFGVADPTFVAVSADRGRPGKVIASIVNGVPFWGITFDASIVPLTKPQQLEGRSVATFPAPSTAYTLQKKMFLDAGLKADIREGSFGTLVAMLKTKRADIALELEPNVSQTIADGAHVVYGLDAIYGDFATTGLTALPDSLARDPELARGVTCALARSLDFIRLHQDDAVRLLSKRFPEVTPPVASAALKRMLGSRILPDSVQTSREAWDKAVSLRRDIGDLKSAGDYAAFVDNSFAASCPKPPVTASE